MNAPMRSRRESQPAASRTKWAHVEIAYAARMCLWIRISPGQQSLVHRPLALHSDSRQIGGWQHSGASRRADGSRDRQPCSYAFAVGTERPAVICITAPTL